MKKLWVFLIAFAMPAAIPVFASDVTISGEWMSWAAWDFRNPGAAKVPKAEINLDAAVDDFNTVKIEFDSEDTLGNLDLDDFRVISDLGAVLKLPVGLETTIGYFDTYFTGWYYWDPIGYTWYYPWLDGVVHQGPTTAAAMQADLGVGPATIHWYNDGAGEDFMVGADVSFMGASVWLAYGSQFRDFGGGTLSIEAKYDLPIEMLTNTGIGAFFRYALGGSGQFAGSSGYAKGDYAYGVNLGVGYSMLSLAAGLEGDNFHVLDNVIVSAKATIMEKFTAQAGVFMDVGKDYGLVTDTTADEYAGGVPGDEINDSSFVGVDLSLSYMVGAAQFTVGYAISGAKNIAKGTKVDVPILAANDNGATKGLYGLFYIPY